MDFTKYYKEFPIKQDYIFFNHSAISPMPEIAKAQAIDFLNQVSSSGSLNWKKWMERVKETRQLLADLIHASSEEIAFIKNTSDGLLKVANSIEWKAGDNIILFENEFPANIYPWSNLSEKGVDIRYIPEKNYKYELQDVKAAMDDKTKLLAVSFVEYTTGYQNKLEAIGELCRQNDVIYVIDGIQGIGAIPLDAKRIKADFIAAESQKWLLGTEGIGFLYVDELAKEKLDFHNFGYNGVENPEDFLTMNQSPASGAREFEEGSLNILGVYLFYGSLLLFQEIGIQPIHDRIIELSDLLIKGLKYRGFTIMSPIDDLMDRSGIISFSHPKQSSIEVFRKLSANRVILSLRRDWIRIAPHFYNDEQEIKRFLSYL